MKLLIASMLILNGLGCAKKSVDEIIKPEDSVLIKSYSIHKNANKIMELADIKTKEKIKEVAIKVEKLKLEAKIYKTQISKIDTVYITEKKNFWGKTKKTIVNKQSIDTITEQ